MKHDTQTLLGMSAEALRQHYEEVRGNYVKGSGRDNRTEAYLMTLNGYIQNRELEEETE